MVVWIKIALNSSDQIIPVSRNLEVAVALGRVEVPEDVELVEWGEDDEDEVPRDEDDAVPLVHLPSVDVRGHDQEDHRREEAERRVHQAWINRKDSAGEISVCASSTF